MYKEPSFTQSDNYLGEKNHSIHIHLNSLFLIFVTETISRNNNNPDRNIFLINVELTSTFLTLQRFGPPPN